MPTLDDIPVNNNGEFDKNLLADLIFNETMTRKQLMSRMMDPRRDIYGECGYPDAGTIDVKKLKELFDREEVASRVVEVYPQECWAHTPKLIEDEDAETETEFEKAFKKLGDSLDDEVSLYEEEEEGNPIWDYLKRADILSGIGHFGLIFLGIDDGEDFSQPIAGFPKDRETTSNAERDYVYNQEGSHELLYLRVYDESLVEVTQWENERTNKRYGRPIMYSVTLNDPDLMTTGQGVEHTQQAIHWSRLVHIADVTHSSSEVMGIPRMRPVLNRLLDLQKIYAACGEGYWQGAFPGFALEIDPAAAMSGKLDDAAIAKYREGIGDYFNSLQRYFLASAATVKSLTPNITDPTPFADAIINAICVKIGVPKRIFTGSERGELASSQDADSWNGRKLERMNNFISPRIIRPFIDRLIRLGILPKPKQYKVKWGDINELKPLEKADMLVKRTEAMSKYVAGGVDQLIVPSDYLTREMGYSDEEAEEILDAAEEHIEEMEAEAEEKRKEAAEELARTQPPPGAEPQPEAGAEVPPRAGGSPTQPPPTGPPVSKQPVGPNGQK